MADDGKPAHYSEKYKAEIEALKAENKALREAAGTSVSVVSPGKPSLPDPMLFAAAFIAANEARNMGTESLLPLLQDRWHAARQFCEWVGAGHDLTAYAERQAALKAEAERLERVKKADEEGEKRKKAEAAARMKGESLHDPALAALGAGLLA